MLKHKNLIHIVSCPCRKVFLGLEACSDCSTYSSRFLLLSRSFLSGVFYGGFTFITGSQSRHIHRPYIFLLYHHPGRVVKNIVTKIFAASYPHDRILWRIK
jgi:hypothetical protein